MNYTTTIETIALESKFNKENIPALLSVVNATENPQIALEILLDIYQYPDIFTVANDSNEQKKRTFVSFEPIGSQVTYSYYPVTTKEAWFKKDEENLSEENIVSTKYWSSGVADELGIPEKEVREIYAYKTYETTVSTDINVRTVSLQEWNNFGQYVPTFEPEELTF